MRRTVYITLILFLSQVVSSCVKFNESDLEKGLYDLYVYDMQSGENTQVTSTAGIMEFPVGFSGSKIIFKDNEGVSRMNVDGTGRELILPSGYYTEFHITINGKFIFIKDGNIFLTNPDGSGETQLTSVPLNYYAPDLSPDGNYISACCDNGLVIINRNTGETEIVNHKQPSSLYSWSSNSGKLTYSIYVDNYSQVFSYDLLTKHEQQLTDNQKFNYFPKWKNGSDQILFTSAAANYGADLILIKSDGSDSQVIIHKGNISLPACSPAGNKVTFINQDGDLAICDITGQNYKVVNNLPGACLEPSWSEDGKYILYYRAFLEL